MHEVYLKQKGRQPKKKTRRHQFSFDSEQRKVVLDMIREKIQQKNDENEMKENATVSSVENFSTEDNDSVSGNDTKIEEGGSTNDLDGELYCSENEILEDDYDFENHPDTRWWTMLFKQLPEKWKSRYRQLCFSKWSNTWLPAIEIGPVDVGGNIRVQWFNKYKGKRKLLHSVMKKYDITIN